MKKGTFKKIIVLPICAIILAVLMAGDYLCYFYSAQITNLLCGTGLSFSGDEVEIAAAESDKLIRNIADEGFVMLKNQADEEGNTVLPLAEDNRKVNLFGWSSSDGGMMYTGDGSGAGWPYGRSTNITLSAAFEASGFEVNRNLLDKYKEYRGWRSNMTLIEPPASFYTDDLIKEAVAFSDTAVVTLSRWGSEGVEIALTQTKYNLPTDTSRTYLQLSTEEEAMLDVVTKNFDKVIVLLNTCNPMEMGFLDNEKIDAAFLVGTWGQSGTTAVPRLMTGEVTPSGKTVDTYPYEHKSNPSYVNMHRDGDHIHYNEDIYIGYKWYETAAAEKITHIVGTTTYDYSTEEGYRSVVQYPFGYGLSYTEFEWNVDSVQYVFGDEKYDLEGASITNKSAAFEVTVSVTNVGNVKGQDVVELYFTAPYGEQTENDSQIEKAYVNLVEFDKTAVLEPGQTQEMTFTFDLYDMASYDCYDMNGNGSATYELDPGDYQIKLMTDAHTVKDCEGAVTTFTLPNLLKYNLDPTTKQIVKNRFTGDTAYADMPIDGQTAGEKIVYVSRANFSKTFPTTKTPNRTSAAVTTANTYVYDGYDTKYATAPTQGVTTDNPLYLWTREDGSKATLDDLNGQGDAKLVLNEGLVETLGRNYNAEEWTKLLNQITVSELFNLVECSGYGNDAIESIGKANNRDYDGPGGFRPLEGTLNGMQEATWSAYPSETNVAQTWNKAIAFQMGRSIGNEGTATGLSGWYAPAVNLHRTPYQGRYFEYYSEDSVLSGMMGAYVVKGAATVNFYCYLKHLALSEMGVNPRLLNVWVTEQALRETYLRAFEIVVKDGEANAIMTAFNRVGAVWAGGCKAMNVDILRTEWGFKGVVLTDWSQGDSYMWPKQGLRAGNDMWLNPNDSNGKPLDRNDPVNINLARNAAHNMIYTICNTYCRYKDYDPAEGEFTATIGIRETEKVFAWWIPVLVGANVLIGGLTLVWLKKTLKPKKKKVAVLTEETEKTDLTDEN